MGNYVISINQLAEFSKASEKGKRRILNQQITPNSLLIPWYQSAKASIKKFFGNLNDTSPLLKGIESLDKKIPLNKRQEIDKKVSIEALNKLKLLTFPKLFKTLDYEIIKVEDKNISFNGVDIKVAPDIIIKGKVNGKVVYGGIKIHICKSKPFDLLQAKYVSNTIYTFLQKKVADKNEKVLAELCFCCDVFSDRIVQASEDNRKEIFEIKNLCLEIIKLSETL